MRNVSPAFNNKQTVYFNFKYTDEHLQFTSLIRTMLNWCTR